MTNLRFSGLRLGFVLVLLCSGALSAVGRAEAAPITVAAIKADPSILNGRRISGTDLENLTINDAHIKGMTLRNVQALKTRARNVTFENCVFSKVDMRWARLENVAFIRCRFEARGDPDKVENITDFNFSRLKNVLFRETVIHDGWFVGMRCEGGYILLDKITDFYGRGAKDGGGLVFSGKDIHFRIRDSHLSAGLQTGSENSSVWARNSRMTFGRLSGDRVFVDSCHLENSEVDGKDCLVVKNSTVLNAKIEPWAKAYLVDNTYPLQAGGKRFAHYGRIGHYGREGRYRGCVIMGTPESMTYVIHNDPAPACISLFSGNATMADVTLLVPRVSQAGYRDEPIAELNLKNVTVHNGGFWGGLNLLGGQWENVRIEPPVYVKNTRINNVKVHNLAFPKGDPWDRRQDQGDPKTPLELNYTESRTPFKWATITVPTPESQGLEWWPEVEPGYRPERASQ